MESGALDHNTMTLTLPRRYDQRGALSFGITPDLTDVKQIRLPLSNQTRGYLSNTWHLALDGVALRGENFTFKAPLKDVYARLDFDPYIGLPSDITKAIYEALNATTNEYLFVGAIIECKTRDTLPELVLNLAGQEIVLDKSDYSFRGRWSDGREVCIISIVPTPAKEEFAILGTNFLNKYHMVFDLDERELGCKFLQTFRRCEDTLIGGSDRPQMKATGLAGRRAKCKGCALCKVTFDPCLVSLRVQATHMAAMP